MSNISVVKMVTFLPMFDRWTLVYILTITIFMVKELKLNAKGSLPILKLIIFKAEHPIVVAKG